MTKYSRKNQLKQAEMQGNKAQIVQEEEGSRKMITQLNKKQLKQIQTHSQDGRSMVEMLGVLAVIGVISIGGIAGYRMAMNRYQANQIANEINLMRTDAKMKVAQGAENLMLGEPYDSGHLNFGSNYGVEFNFAVFSEAGEPEESGYYIKVAGVPAGVCKPLVTLLEGMDDAIAVVVNEQENNADSSADLCTEESNNALEVDFSTKDIGGASGGSGNPEVTDPEQGDEPQDAPECNLDTCPGGTCNDEGVCECPENKNWTGTDCITCPPGTTWNDTERDCVCSDGKYLYGNQCVTCDSSTGGTWDSENKRCKCDNGIWDMEEGKCVNASCGTGGMCDEKQYCDTSPTSRCSNGKNTKADQGTCKDIDIGNVQEKTINGKTYYYKSGSFDWWSAQRYCQALAANGKGHGLMVSLEELGCTTSGCSGDGALQKALYGTCKKGEACCTEGKLCCDKDSECPSFSNWVWTSTTQGSNSCNAYNVTLYNGAVHNYTRYATNSALCE